MQLHDAISDMYTDIPDYVSITPRVGTQDYSDYWAATAPTLTNPTDIQSAILNAGGGYTPINISQGIPIATSTPSGVTSSGSGVTIASMVDLAKAGLTAYGQIQLMNLQADLIKQGRPPLTAAQVAAMAPQLNVGLAPDTQNMLMYALMGGAALLLIVSLTGKKSRR